MARNGSGTYSLPAGNPFITGSVISSTTMNNTLSDIAAALTASIANDGQTPILAGQDWGGFNFSNIGNLTATALKINGAAATERALYFLTAGSNRWIIDTNNVAESGSNAGSDWALTRFDDSGVYLGTAISGVRATGILTFEKTPLFPTAAVGDNSTKGATTGFIAAKSLARTMFSYRNNVAQTSGTTVIFNTALIGYHGNGSFNTATGVFTAAVDGYYDFNADITANNGTGLSVNESLAISVGGVNYAQCTALLQASTQTTYTLATGPVFMSAGQTASVISVNAFAANYSVVFGSGLFSKFSGYRIDTI